MSAARRLTLRASDDVMSDVEVIATATGLATSDVLRVAVRRLADGYRFLADTERDTADCLTDSGVIVTMPVVRRRM